METKTNQLLGLANCTALIVEDNQSDVMLSKLILQQQGLSQVDVANDAFTALDYLADKQDQFNLIILDINLPQMSGKELLKRIRRMKKYEKTPILIVSSRNEASHIVECVTVGANDYIIKPIDPMVMQNKVQNLLKSKIQDWFEYIIPTTSQNSNASVLIRKDVHLKSISEVGFTISTNYEVQIDTVVQFESELLRSANIGQLVGRVIRVSKTDDQFVLSLTFVGITNEMRQQIRSICKQLWAQEKSL